MVELQLPKLIARVRFPSSALHVSLRSASQIVVDTGPWIFGRKVLLPAGTIDRVDDAEEKVYVDLTKDQIKASPELEEGTTWEDAAYRERVGGYYSGFYGY
jgi:hypothetical protein